MFDAIAHWQSETLIDENEEQKSCDLPPITSVNRIFGEHTLLAIAPLAAKIPDTLTETRCSQIDRLCSVESIQKILCGRGTVTSIVNPSLNSTGPHKVIVHADLWPNNILWTQSINDPAVAGDQLLALLDWQAALYGIQFINLTFLTV